MATTDESLAVETCARDYIEAWYSCDGDRMARCLHPDLVKRVVGAQDEGGAEVICNTTASHFVDHLQLAKFREGWKIVNVLWQPRDQRR